jgi:iron complex outermembrane receptor protein
MFSLSSGIHWHFTQDIALALMLGRSQRGPSAEELFSNGPHEATATFEIGQADLDVETVNSIDLGLSREMGRWQWSVNLFANYIENFIFLQGLDRDNDGVVDEVDDDGISPGELLLVQYQQDDAIFYGFELETGVNLYSGAEGLVDLRLFSDYVRAQRTNGENLPRISPARIGAGLDYTRDKLTAGIDWTQVLAQNANGSLESDTDGYSLLNLNANYALFEGENSLSLFARANNLLDEDGRMHTSFIKDRAPIMGRSLMVGFDASF